MEGYVPVQELRDLLDCMRRMAKRNEEDLAEYKAKGFDDSRSLVVQARAHKYDAEMWARDVEEIIKRCEEGEYEDE